ncbi:MAG TPA: lytic transglycosylase domain-containing protein [Acidobacteriaceae bacterium]|nr:lytic transglycosylase domain-containing protein [Acidobacteriaceae bacterium]
MSPGWIAAGLAILSASMALPSRAAERITLKNGFDLVCDHQQQMDGRVRLYTGPAADSFLEVDAAQIASVETIPDAAPAERQPAGSKTPPSRVDLNQLMARAGSEHNVDLDLLASVVRAESGGNARAVSRAGAQGLMQLMPRTAAKLGVEDSFSPDQNIGGGTAYLDVLLTRYHDNMALALAAYNAGPAAVDKYHGVPPYAETERYVARVIREFNRRKEGKAAFPSTVAHGGASHSAE